MDTTENFDAVGQDRRLVGARASDDGHPFRVNFRDAELTELHRRISATQLPGNNPSYSPGNFALASDHRAQRSELHGTG